MCQMKYVVDILEEKCLIGTNPVETLIDPSMKMCVDQGKLLSNLDSYRRLVEKLNYLIITRSNISLAVSVISQFMSTPRSTDIEAALRIVRYMRYLKEHPRSDLFYEVHGHLRIEAFTNSD